MLEVFLTRFNAESRKGIKIHNALELFRPIRFILLQRKLRPCTYIPLNLLLYWTYDQGISPHVYKINICLSAKSSYKNTCLQVNLLSSLFAQSLQKGLGDRTKLQHREKYINGKTQCKCRIKLLTSITHINLQKRLVMIFTKFTEISLELCSGFFDRILRTTK